MICSKCAYEDFNPNIRIHPGEILKDILKNYKIKQKDLARFMGISEKHLSNIIKGKADINYRLAFELEKVLKISAEFWLNMQNGYNLFELRK